MAQLIDPRQYFLDIIAKSRLSTGNQAGIQLQIDIAKARYENLDISEVVFSDERFDEVSGQWSLDIECKGRGYVINDLKFTSGTLAPMIKQNAVQAVEELLEITTPGFYIHNDQLYLLAPKDMEVAEMLAWTGYDITEKHYVVVENESRDEETKADAEIQVSYNFLKGKILVTYLDVKPSVPAIDLEQVGMGHDIEKLEQAQLDHEEPLVEEQQPVTDEEVLEEQVVAEEEPVTETVAEEVQTVQEEEVKAPVQQVQNTSKNKRR